MQGANLLLMNQATVMAAVQFYLNSVVVRDSSLVCVTGFTPRVSGQDAGLYEVQIQPQEEVKDAA